ncbi:MAG: [FeFe] hydrogenase H-cluster radical SAM maturase HydE [Clostridiales bacterium]
MKELIAKLKETGNLTKAEWITLIDGRNEELSQYLFSQSRKKAQEYYGKDIYIRGLIEISNYCKNNCFYCGIRKGNKEVIRYHLSKAEILDCCRRGYEVGFRTFVLQGGEDDFYSDEVLVDIIKTIKTKYPDCAVTLSIGEREYQSYKALYNSGADRYLLRHETFNSAHYRKLHPGNLTAEHRQMSLRNLKKIGFQTGSGFMVGSPYQTTENIAEDMLFIKDLNPEMVGIGPFIPHHSTVFAHEPQGTLELTLFIIGLLRLMNPRLLLPATTALGTICPQGRIKGILAGANVVMPNISPVDLRKNYELYDNKIYSGNESGEDLKKLKEEIQSIGYEVKVAKGDYIKE